MPFTLLAHQAPVLPLKLGAPRRFSGLALVFGSMAPDLEYFIHADPEPVIGHSLRGQLVWCLPLTLLLVAVTRWVVAEPLAAHLPERLRGAPLHLDDYRAVARTRPGAGDLLVVVASALLGSLSHIALDGLTHEHGWAVALVPGLRHSLFHVFGRPVPVYRLLQGLLSALGAVATALVVLYIGRTRQVLRWAGTIAPPERLATARSRTILVGALAFGLAAGVVIRFAIVPSHRAYRDAWYWGHELLQMACYAFVGLALGCALCRRAMARATAFAD